MSEETQEQKFAKLAKKIREEYDKNPPKPTRNHWNYTRSIVDDIYIHRKIDEKGNIIDIDPPQYVGESNERGSYILFDPATVDSNIDRIEKLFGKSDQLTKLRNDLKAVKPLTKQRRKTNYEKRNQMP